MFFNYFSDNDAVVRSLRLALKKMPASTNDAFPNMWCEILDQMLNGWYSSRSLYENIVIGIAEKYLWKYYDEQALLNMWIENYAHKEYSDEADYPGELSDYMVEELAELVAEVLYGEDAYELDEEIRKGRQALEARERRNDKKVKIQV